MWIVHANAFDGTRWQQTLSEALLTPAMRLVLVVLGSKTPGGALRQALERLAFANGFRKHPAYYLMLDYEALHLDAGPLVVPLEKLPESAHLAYPLRALEQERDLHMDMLRESGERSDAHVVRYHLAAELIKAGDRVLDAACGLGYGSYVLSHLTRCHSVVGVDGSDYAINYATSNFGATGDRLNFMQGWLPDRLNAWPDDSFDVVVSFETLEHVQDPQNLLAEFSRLLRPGGRIIASVPNDWADETGKDPNPYHLHVYTLATLRQQFAQYFSGERLHQQIASGCKRRVTGNRWASLPRTLRELPVDIAQAPDSEWWIVSGCKPTHQAGVDYTHPSFQEAAPTGVPNAAQSELARGLVLAMHFVPADIDPAVEAFWSELSRELATRGFVLVLLSTTTVRDPALNVVEMPYELTAFQSTYGQYPLIGAAVDEEAVENAVSWYSCDHSVARTNLRLAQAFLSDLMDTLRPSTVLGWQDLHPLTRQMRQQARAADVPCWSGERGWVRNTLMFDLGGIHLLSEVRTSLPLSRARARYQPEAGRLDELALRAHEASSLGRYTTADRVSGEALRQRLGIAPGDCVVTLFTHGEPGVNALGNPAVREFHDISPHILQARLDAVAHALAARGCWLLVQEHPFNAAAGRELRLPDLPRVRKLREDVSSLVDASQALLFTLATLQFDAVFLNKPMGLLSRSALYRDGVPPFLGDHASPDEFLDSLFDENAWPDRHRQLQEEVAFLYDNLLLDIAPERLAESSRGWADVLCEFTRSVDSGFDARVESFLQRWSTRGG